MVLPEIATLDVVRLLLLRCQTVAAASGLLRQVQIGVGRVQSPSKLGPLAGALLQIPDRVVRGEEAAVGPSGINAVIFA